MFEYLNQLILAEKFQTVTSGKIKIKINLFYKKRKKKKLIPVSSFNTVSKQLDKIPVPNLPKCLHFCYEVLILATDGYSSIKSYYIFFAQ